MLSIKRKNIRQIVEKYKDMENDIKELCCALNALGEEVGEDSKTFIIVENLYNEKQKELRDFGFIDWEEKEEKDTIF
jgi:hypothetical protein